MGHTILVSACLCVGVLSTGCASPLALCEAQFKEGAYPEAKASLAALESRAAHWSTGEQAEYALYRGLTYGALGDLVRAAAWLRRAQAIRAADPSALSDQDARRLALAAEALAAADP